MNTGHLDKVHEELVEFIRTHIHYEPLMSSWESVIARILREESQ